MPWYPYAGDGHGAGLKSEHPVALRFENETFEVIPEQKQLGQATVKQVPKLHLADLKLKESNESEAVFHSVDVWIEVCISLVTKRETTRPHATEGVLCGGTNNRRVKFQLGGPFGHTHSAFYKAWGLFQ